MLKELESALVDEYRGNSQLQDLKVAMALDHAKVALKQEFGFAKKETVSDEWLIQGIIEKVKVIGCKWIADHEDIDVRCVVSLVDKVKRSVNRHSSHGLRGYYEFVKNFV